MRVLIAPDKFAGTLTAVQAAEAIAEGWRRRAPDDVLDLAPMADGGPGFIDVLHAALGGELLSVTVSGPHGAPVPATVLVVGETAYVESAQACGLHLLEGSAETASTFGVGELLGAAIDAGARTVVVGLGGSGTNDGGAGLLAALGATGPLRGGATGLKGVTAVDLEPARHRVRGVEILAASDVDNPLTGLFGATKTYGPQKGIAEERIAEIDGWLEEFAKATDRRVSLDKGAGAAGGLGFALMLLGSSRAAGLGLVAESVDLLARAGKVDLVITGEGSFDFSTKAGKVPAGVADISAEALRPCLILAGQVQVGSREMRAMGVESAYSVSDLVGEEESLARPAESLAALAERVARNWSR
jgi:glycerate kinase